MEAIKSRSEVEEIKSRNEGFQTERTLNGYETDIQLEANYHFRYKETSENCSKLGIGRRILILDPISMNDRLNVLLLAIKSNDNEIKEAKRNYKSAKEDGVDYESGRRKIDFIENVFLLFRDQKRLAEAAVSYARRCKDSKLTQQVTGIKEALMSRVFKVVGQDDKFDRAKTLAAMVEIFSQTKSPLDDIKLPVKKSSKPVLFVHQEKLSSSTDVASRFFVTSFNEKEEFPSQISTSKI